MFSYSCFLTCGELSWSSLKEHWRLLQQLREWLLELLRHIVDLIYSRQVTARDCWGVSHHAWLPLSGRESETGSMHGMVAMSKLVTSAGGAGHAACDWAWAAGGAMGAEPSAFRGGRTSSSPSWAVRGAAGAIFTAAGVVLCSGGVIDAVVSAIGF